MVPGEVYHVYGARLGQPQPWGNPYGDAWDDAILEREKVQKQKSFTEIVNPEVRDPIYNASVRRWR